MEFIEIIISAAQEAFMHVGVLLAIVILLFGFLDYKTGGNIVNILEKNKKLQPILGAILGVIPGCGGSIILIPLYVKNKVSFGALAATLISSMGDAAFILISTDIKSYIFVSLISFITAAICGYIFDMLHIDEKLKLRKNKLDNCNCSTNQNKDFDKGMKIDLCTRKHIGHEENDEIDHALHHSQKNHMSKFGYKFTHSIGYKLFYAFIILGLILTLVSGEGLVHDHSHTSSHTEEHTHELEEDSENVHDHDHESEETSDHTHDHDHESEETSEHTHDHDHESEETSEHTHDHNHEIEEATGDTHIHSHSHEVLSIESLISILGIALSIAYTLISKKYLKNSTHEEVESKISSFKEMIIHTASEAAFVITWIFIGYLIYDIAVMFIGGEQVLNSVLLASGPITVIIGAMLGIIPGCGIQVIFISLYAKGAMPFAALIANSISQDGDALFPLIAMDKKSALWATILTTIPAILVGLIVYFVMN